MGVIKARAEELGATIAPISNADRAEVQKRQAAFDDETAKLLSNGAMEFNAAADVLMNAIRAEIQTIIARTGWKIECGPGALIRGFVVTTGSQTLHLASADIYANTARSAYLKLTEYDVGIPVHQDGFNYFFPEGLNSVGTTRLDIRRLPVVGWCWEMYGSVYGPMQTASEIAGILLDRIEREAATKHKGHR